MSKVYKTKEEKFIITDASINIDGRDDDYLNLFLSLKGVDCGSSVIVTPFNTVDCKERVCEFNKDLNERVFNILKRLNKRCITDLVGERVLVTFKDISCVKHWRFEKVDLQERYLDYPRKDNDICRECGKLDSHCDGSEELCNYIAEG